MYTSSSYSYAEVQVPKVVVFGDQGPWKVLRSYTGPRTSNDYCLIKKDPREITAPSAK